MIACSNQNTSNSETTTTTTEETTTVTESTLTTESTNVNTGECSVEDESSQSQTTIEEDRFGECDNTEE